MSSNVMSPSCSELLGKDRLSLSGKRWLLKAADSRQALAISQRLHIPEILGRVLSDRGLDVENAPAFLDPKIKTELPDPLHLKDMDIAANRLVEAIKNGEKIAIFGDYDVDGATSSAVLKRFIESSGGIVQVYIPDRLDEGYGPNAPALLKLQSAGVSLVITVDCGQTSFDVLAEVADEKLDIIVVDHHQGEAQLPKAVAVINPNRMDETSPHGQMAAVGVAFLLAVATNAMLRDAGWFTDDRPAPNLMALLDIVALGTVCDVVPLTGVNRAFVSQGLKVMAKRQNLGLKALADVAAIKEVPTAYHLGFVMGPRMNAGGRVGQSELGQRLLTTQNSGEATALADRLNVLNGERQGIEAAVLIEATDILEQKLAGNEPDPLIFVCGEGWHPGVIGIVASRLKDKFNRPTCVISMLNDLGTASGRSVKGADLGAAVIAARQSGLLIKGGGHAMAAGFTVDREQLARLEAFLSQRMVDDLGKTPPPPGLYIDAISEVQGANYHVVKTLDRLAPFGVDNPEPRFCIHNAKIAKINVVGADQNHVRMILVGEGGQGKLTAMAFRAFDSDLGNAFMNHGGKPFSFVGRLRMNVWNGYESVQLMVDDAVSDWTGPQPKK